jgi:hypothetical protein
LSEIEELSPQAASSFSARSPLRCQDQEGGGFFVADDRGRWELGGVAAGWVASDWLQGRRLQAASLGRGRDEWKVKQERLQCCIVDSW